MSLDAMIWKVDEADVELSKEELLNKMYMTHKQEDWYISKWKELEILEDLMGFEKNTLSNNELMVIKSKNSNTYLINISY